MAVSETPAVIVESIAIEAPIAAVFAALTLPEQLVQWWNSVGLASHHHDGSRRSARRSLENGRHG